MAAGGYQDANTQHCEVCGRALPATDSTPVATRALCLHCALDWQMHHRSDWPPPGYVWDGERVRFDPTMLTQRPFTGYQPSEREIQWWCFLSWLVATGRMAVGLAEGEGAEDEDE